MNTPFLGLVIYLVLIAAVAVWTFGMNRTKEEFILGGRRLGAWIIALSERTAAESSWLILGLSGAFFASGMVEIWTLIGCISGIIFYWYAIAKKLRIRSEEMGAITLPEYFFKFSGPYGRQVRAVSMLIITFFFAFYVAAQFKGAEKMIAVTFGIESAWVMPGAAAVVVLYTMMGGFVAVCYTDVVQAVLMILTLVLMPIVGMLFMAHEGIDLDMAMKASGHDALFGGKTGWGAVAVVIGGLSWGLGNMGQPHLVTKFMAINSPDAVRLSRKVAIVWTIVAYIGAALVGLIGMSLLRHGSLDSVALAADQERILPTLAGFLFPAWIAGILIAGAVAAMMSTADSQLLITTSTLVEDFYAKALGKTLSERAMLNMSRAATAAIGLIALGLAAISDNLIYDVVSMSWAGLGSAFGPVLLLSLHWKKMNGCGVLWGMITGAVTTTVWNFTPGLNAIINIRFTAFVFAMTAAVLGARYASKR